MPLAVVQYYFEEGVEVPVKLAKHGNAKEENSTLYMRTSRPVLDKLKEKCAAKTCRKAVEECFQEGGGTCGIKAVADVPRNRKQAHNLPYQMGKESQIHGSKQSRHHEFYDVLELLNQGTFVRDFACQRSASKSRTHLDRFRLQISRSPNYPAYVHPKSTLQYLEFMPPLIVATFLAPSPLLSL